MNSAVITKKFEKKSEEWLKIQNLLITVVIFGKICYNSDITGG